ncbi:unnamed protein product [Closterium sp. NIES-53]
MASPSVLTFDADGRAVDFEVWIDDLQLFLQCDSKDGLSLFDLTSGASTAPAADADSTFRSQWTTRDAAARLAVRSYLPSTERAHFSQYKSAKTLYDAVVARYSSPATAALSRLMLPYLFPDLAAFATVTDLITHLHTSDTRYCAALPAEFCAKNPPIPVVTVPFSSHVDAAACLRIVGDASAFRVWGSRAFVRDLSADKLSSRAIPCVFLGFPPDAPGWQFYHPTSRRVLSSQDVTFDESVPYYRLFPYRAAPLPPPPLFLTPDAVEPVEVAVESGACGVAEPERAEPGGARHGGAEPECAEPGLRVTVTGVCRRTQALHTFTLDSGSSRCFFRDGTTLTPLPAPVPIRQADPSGGPVVACSSTVLPCPAVPSGSLSGLHLPSFPTNLVSTATLQDAMVTTTTPRGQRVSICTCTRTARHLATFTRRPGASQCTLTTEPPQVAASVQMSASGQVVASCSCRLISHQTRLWHYRVGHPSLPRLRGMHSRLLVSGLPRSLPPLPPSPTPPCLPCVEGRQRAAPHSSSFPPTTSPLQTLHMDVWGPARVSGQGCERYFLLVVDDYMRGGEFSSDLLWDFCRGEGILQSFTLSDSPQQNGIGERRIGLVMEVARTSMIHAAAPHFLWPFAVQYAAHQFNLWPWFSFPETSPTLRWTGKVGDASVFWVRGSCAFVRDTSADKLSAYATPCVFLGFIPDAPGWQFYHPTSRRVFPSQDVTFDDSVPFYRLFPYRSALPPPPLLFLAPGPPPVDPLPPQGPAPSGVARGAASGGAEPGVAESEGARSRGADPGGEEPGGVEPAGVEPGGAESEGAESGGAEPPVGGTSAGGAVAGGAGAVDPGGSVRPRPYFVPLLQQVLGVPSSTSLTPPLLCPPPDQSQLPLHPASPLPAPSPYTEQFGSLTERREPASRPVSPVLTDRRVPHSRPPPVPSTHAMALRPSSVPLRVALPAPPESSLPAVPDPESDHACATSPTVSQLLATVVTGPSFESTATSALVVELVDFVAASRLDYATALVAESECASPPSVEGECDLSTHVLEDRQEDFECHAAAVPRFASMRLARKAPMDAEMASWKSTGTYVDEVPPPGANIDNGMWIFRVKRPPGSPLAVKARYVARGFRQRQGADYFQTFSPSPPKMTTLRVLLHVAAQWDYDGSFPAGTQWSLRWPVYGLRQAPREWHATLRTTLAALGFSPCTAHPSMFLFTDTSLPSFYILVYVDHLVFANADTEALNLVLQKRHTCTDLGELRSYLGLQITRDRAWRTITLTQSHMVHQVLQRFGFQYSLPQPTPLSTGHSLSAPPSDESVETSGPYPELVGCLITSGMGLVLAGRGLVVLTGHSDASGFSCEAEIYTGAMAAQELRWLTYLLTDLGEQPRSPPFLYVDNKAMIALCQEHRLEHRRKHIALRYFLSRELQQRGQLRLAYVATRANFCLTSPTLRWTGKVGDALVFRVWGSRAFVRDTSADKLSSRAIPFVFLGFPPDAPGWQFYHPTSRRVLPSQVVMFDESVPFYRLFPYRTAPLPPSPLFVAPGPPPVDPLPPRVLLP